MSEHREINTIHVYKIDFDKVKTTEDIIRILSAIDPTFGSGSEEAQEKIKDLLRSELLTK